MREAGAGERRAGRGAWAHQVLCPSCAQRRGLGQRRGAQDGPGGGAAVWEGDGTPAPLGSTHPSLTQDLREAPLPPSRAGVTSGSTLLPEAWGLSPVLPTPKSICPVLTKPSSALPRLPTSTAPPVATWVTTVAPFLPARQLFPHRPIPALPS